MRQPGVGSQGGAEALAIFHQLLYDERASGTYATPLAGIKVDEENGVGTIEWGAFVNGKFSSLQACCSGRM